MSSGLRPTLAMWLRYPGQSYRLYRRAMKLEAALRSATRVLAELQERLKALEEQRRP